MTGLAALLVLVATGCGPSTETLPADLAGTFELEADQTANITPGTVLNRGEDGVRFRASAPGFSFTVTTAGQEPPATTVTLSNLAAASGPGTDVAVAAVETISNDSAPGCSGGSSGAVDCETSDSPACTPPMLQPAASGTRYRLLFDLPACIRVRYRFTPRPPVDRPYRMAIIGATDSPRDLGRLLDAVESRQDPPIDLAVVTGDNADHRTVGALSEFAGITRGRSVPTVVLPGETEHLQGVQGGFQSRFGPDLLHWQLGAVDFLTFGSAWRTLQGEEAEALERRLERTNRNTPTVALTHAPPVDPEDLRGQGFRSRLEGARILSLLRSGGVDLLGTGHLPSRERSNLRELQVVAASARRTVGYTLVEIDGDESIGRDFEIQRVDLRP